MAKMRLDLLLVERGLAETRSRAQRLVMAGQVRVDGQIVDRPGASVGHAARLEIDRGPRFVSRGGEKLEAGLSAFSVSVQGFVCADVGSSTGGFTDCLLQGGAKRVYAIDVGQGILDWKLRQNQAVVVMEGTNARYVASLPEPVDLVTIDASFISLKILLPVAAKWFGSGGGNVIALIKPQFEAGKALVARGKGVVRNPEVHRQVLEDVLASAQQEGYSVQGLIRSPLLGPKGNTEFLAHLVYPGEDGQDIQAMLDQLEPAAEDGDQPAAGDDQR
jgi:23S rRNA (cytidine1920-2'-O)/16S rRNA (cytidine1409-2'-O)-methyltransferase